MTTFADLRRAHYPGRAAFAAALTTAGVPISASSVGHWEHAQKLPTGADLEVIARVLGTTRDDVIAAFVATMHAEGRLPSAVDWEPELWYVPCIEMVAAREERYRAAQAEYERAMQRAMRPKPRSGLDILIDRACGLE